MKKISVAVPCYNEVGNVREMAESLVRILNDLPYDYEIIFTDNCSTDGTKDILRELAGKDKHIKVLMNSRNYGTDGRSDRNTLQYVSGDIYICLACDFQEPPELIPEFVKYWEQGYKVVYGQKIGSEEGRLKTACRSLYYKIINKLSDVPQYEHISGIHLLDRTVLDEFLKTNYDYQLRFAVADMGCDVKLIQYKQRMRKSGRSSYNNWRYLNFAITSMVTTSNSPLRIMTVAGAVMTFLTFAAGLLCLVLKLIFWDSSRLGTMWWGCSLYFLGSVLLLCVGIVGEYIGEILKRVSSTPSVILTEKINFDDPTVPAPQNGSNEKIKT